MTYAMSLSSVGFVELTRDEMLCVDGGFPWDKIGEAISATAGGSIGAYTGAKIGAAIGTASAPGIGTVVGALIGGAIGVGLYCLFD